MMFKLLLILCLGHRLPAVLGTDLDIDVPVGHDATLVCYGSATTDTKKLFVEWSLDGSAISWFKDDRWCESGHYVNRTRLGSIEKRNFSLIISKVTKKDHGLYTCQINNGEKLSIRLYVEGGRKRRDTEMSPGDPVCKPYREREDPSGSITKDEQISDENPPGPPLEEQRQWAMGPVKIVLIVLAVVAVVAVGAVGSIQFWRKQQTEENLRDCTKIFACGKGKKKRRTNLPDTGTSNNVLINSTELIN